MLLRTIRKQNFGRFGVSITKADLRRIVKNFQPIPVYDKFVNPHVLGWVTHAWLIEKRPAYIWGAVDLNKKGTAYIKQKNMGVAPEFSLDLHTLYSIALTKRPLVKLSVPPLT